MSVPNSSTATSKWSQWLAATAASLMVLLGSSAAHGEGAPLTRVRIAELVPEAPSVRVARSEAAVSGAAVKGAGVVSLEEPVLSGLGGVRFNADGSRPFNGVATLSWPLELGGKRGARIEAAQAEHRAARALEKHETRQVLLDALLQHCLVLRDERAASVAAARHTLSERVYAAAQRRYAAGGVPELDVALAALQEKRDASAEASALGSRAADKVALLTLLGLPDDLPVEGTLVPEGEPSPLAALVPKVDERPDVRAATEALRAAQAKAERERSVRAPTVSLLAQYERDDRDDIALIGLAVPLPILNANRAEVASSAAQASAAKARAARARTLAAGQLRELYARYVATKAAMDSLAPTAALATRAVSLATRGYELGENDLASVLLVRREALEAEASLLEAQHAHATIKIELLIVSGKVPQ